jgi:NhaP-type Na+/H+ or K+/H+ antiporter
MFKQIVTHKGFWKSVISLGLAFVILFLLIKWAIEGFSTDFISEQNPLYFILGACGAGFVYGFFVSYGKFRARIKKNNPEE